MVRILIADDHQSVRKAVRNLIENTPGWQVVAEASDGERALELALEEKPDIAVLDVGLPLLDGVALTQRLRGECPQTRVLLFTMHDDDETVSGGLAAGALGFVLKSDGEGHLEAAISALGENRHYFSSSVVDVLVDITIASARASKASPRGGRSKWRN